MPKLKNEYRLTIITATYNCGIEFLNTAFSIEIQKRKDIQWIICDGGSGLETQKLFEKCSNLISVLISEADDGIYDAWNKACEYIEGEWVMFLGAGDELYNDNVVTDFFSIIDESNFEAELIYGKLQLTNERGEGLKIIGDPWNKIKNKWQHGRKKLPVHPEVFHHKSLFEKQKFNTYFKIVGDSDFLLRSIARCEPQYIDLKITKMQIGGISQKPQSQNALISEIRFLNMSNGLVPPKHIWMLFRMRLYLKNILGQVFNEKYYLRIRSLFKI